MGFMMWGAAGCQSGDGVFIPLIGVCATRTEQIVVVDCHCPLGRADPGMDSISTELALLAIDRLAQWGLFSNPCGHPNYHPYLASLLMTVS